ncbi:hypothetical protein B0H66DRAFT_398299 [Apodospora peruviana]|uniref:Uncharacterized protein n=1 Tax=Apodospora peruviana TaxID=516989 RepID=A0AAE0LYH5_9PEZI|nr:hypothetical protein B0H66DRAFT_398299 [Apodospora peruviana]
MRCGGVWTAQRSGGVNAEPMEELHRCHTYKNSTPAPTNFSGVVLISNLTFWQRDGFGLGVGKRVVALVVVVLTLARSCRCLLMLLMPEFSTRRGQEVRYLNTTEVGDKSVARSIVCSGLFVKRGDLVGKPDCRAEVNGGDRTAFCYFARVWAADCMLIDRLRQVTLLRWDDLVVSSTASQKLGPGAGPVICTGRHDESYPVPEKGHPIIGMGRSRPSGLRIDPVC